MGPVTGKKKKYGANRPYKNSRTRPHAKDLDEIHVIVEKEKAQPGSVKYPFDPDLPGCGQFPCLPCDRHFISVEDREKHYKGNGHKRRMKDLAEVPEDLKLQKLMNPIEEYKKVERMGEA